MSTRVDFASGNIIARAIMLEGGTSEFALGKIFLTFLLRADVNLQATLSHV